MKLMHRILTGLLVLVLATVAQPVFAQDTPATIREVMIRDLASRFGVTGRPSSWRHTIETSADSNLGCPLLDAGDPLPNLVNVYVTTLNYGASQYTYRISEDQSVVVVCDVALLSTLGVAEPSDATGNIGINQIDCPVSAPATLGINAVARVTLPDLTLFQDLDPASNIVATLPSGATMIVVDGPFCDPDLVWWLVNVNGLLGYTHEINYAQNIRFIELVTSGNGVATPAGSNTGVAGPGLAAGSTTCPADFLGYAPARLVPGFQGRVEGGGINNIIRANYGRSANYVTEMPPGSVFSVIGGPECTGANLGEAIVWFQVNWNGTIGWTAESFNSDYFVEPLGGDAGNVEVLQGAIQPESFSQSGLPRYTLPATSGTPISLETASRLVYQGGLQLAKPGSGLQISANGLVAMGVPEGFEVYQISPGGELTPQFSVQFQEPSLFWGMSADGSTIATTRGNPNEGQMLILYDTLTSNATTMMPLPGVNNLGDVALNADGSRVAVAYETVTGASSVTAVDLIDPAANSRMTLPHNSAVTTLAFSPDGGVLATYAMQTDQILIWSMRDNSVIGTWDSDVSGSLDATSSIPPTPPAMVFNPGSTTLAIGGRLGTVEVWSLIGQNRLSSFEVSQEGSGAVQALAFSPDNNVLLAAGGAFDHGPNRPEEPLMIFNLTNGQVMQTAFTPVDVTTGMAFSPNGIRLFTLTGFDYLLMYGVQ